MFDIGLMEIMVVVIIALIVIGPERMPEVARKLGSFMGKTKRFIHSMKENSELSEAVRDIKESIDFEQERKELTNLTQQIDTEVHQAAQPTAEMDFSDFARPFDEMPENSLMRDNQYNKAPAHPQIPQPNAKAETTTETNPTTTDTPTTETPTATADASVQPDTQPLAEPPKPDNATPNTPKTA